MQKESRSALKRMTTIGLRVVRELESKLTVELQKHYEQEFVIYEKALTQEQNMKVKICSFHKPHPACIVEGKAHKTYEFGTKVAIIRRRNTGIITAVKRFSGNPHNSKTLEESLAQSERVITKTGGTRPKTASSDRGFRRQTQV